MIEDDQIGAGRFAPSGDFCHLAATREQRRVGLRTACRDHVDELRAGRGRERLQLPQALRRVALAEVELDEQRPVALGRTFTQASRSLSCGIVMARAGTTVEIACLYTIWVTVFLSRTTY